MTQTMSHTAETLPIQSDDGSYLGEIALDLEDDTITTVAVSDEDGATITLGLSIDEVEALIAKLAVKAAQIRMRQA